MSIREQESPYQSRRSPEEHQFREQVARDNVGIQDGETVMEFIQRFGFPFSVHPAGERHDN